jgi:hypothetical protein
MKDLRIYGRKDVPRNRIFAEMIRPKRVFEIEIPLDF